MLIDSDRRSGHLASAAAPIGNERVENPVAYFYGVGPLPITRGACHDQIAVDRPDQAVCCDVNR